jgi:putative membrane protein
MVAHGPNLLESPVVVHRNVKLAPGRLLTLGFVLLGLVAIGVFLIRVGVGPILGSLQSLGLFGFAVFCVYTLGVLSLLGLSWYVIASDVPVRQLSGFVFGRIMREVAADIMPFAQVGGFVLGVRGACLFGVSTSLAVASTLVDLGAEMAGQLLFTAIGLSVLSLHPPPAFPHRVVDPVIYIGFGLGVATVVGFFFSQRFVSKALTRLSARWPKQIQVHLASVQVDLGDIYREPARVALSIALHVLAWLTAVGGVWLILGLMGARLPLPMVLVLESLVYLLRSAAFFVPGAIGVMEGGYVLLGPIFGLPAEAALSLALIKRGRDLAIGLAAIAVWQVLEGKRLFGWGSNVGRAAGPNEAGKIGDR